MKKLSRRERAEGDGQVDQLLEEIFHPGARIREPLSGDVLELGADLPREAPLLPLIESIGTSLELEAFPPVILRARRCRVLPIKGL